MAGYRYDRQPNVYIEKIMKDRSVKQFSVEIDHGLGQLLKRCSAIEGRALGEIVSAVLTPYLQKYRYATLEEWELARDTAEISKAAVELETGDGFDPNSIPFDTQILGIRRKLDDLQREIEAGDRPRPDLEQLRFTLLEDLNFAEKEALQKKQEERRVLSAIWQQKCNEIPLE